MAEAGPDGWFAGTAGPSGAVEEANRVAARLAAPADGATRAGLPRRAPKAHLVPGSFETGAVPETPKRSADEVRERLRGYRSGMQRARDAD